MRAISILALVCVAACAPVGVDPTLWQIDLLAHLADEARRNATLACLLELGPCAEGDMTKIKDNIVETLGKDCSACSPEDKAQYEKAFGAVAQKYPELITALRVKYPGAAPAPVPNQPAQPTQPEGKKEAEKKDTAAPKPDTPENQQAAKKETGKKEAEKIQN